MEAKSREVAGESAEVFLHAKGVDVHNICDLQIGAKDGSKEGNGNFRVVEDDSSTMDLLVFTEISSNILVRYVHH